MNLHYLGAAINGLARLSPKLAGRIALRLFISPRRVGMSEQTAAYLSKGEQLEVQWRERLVGYRFQPQRLHEEDAPPPRVLLVHGWESHAGRWVPLIQRLRKAGCEVTAFDGPAAGKSSGKKTPFNTYIDAIRQVERHFGPFDVMVGHSLGGGVVAQLLNRLPDARVPARAVIMAGFDESNHVFDRYHEMLKLNERVRASFDTRIVAQLSGVPGEASIRDYSNTAALVQCGDVAGLVIHSVDDEVSPYREGVALHKAWPGSVLLSFDDERHKLTGKSVLEAVVDFVVR